MSSKETLISDCFCAAARLKDEKGMQDLISHGGDIDKAIVYAGQKGYLAELEYLEEYRKKMVSVGEETLTVGDIVGLKFRLICLLEKTQGKLNAKPEFYQLNRPIYTFNQSDAVDLVDCLKETISVMEYLQKKLEVG